MDSLATVVLKTLGSITYKELEIIWNLKKDIERMEQKVKAIKAVLLDAEAKKANNQISNWLEELKDVLYDADDLLDDFNIEALKRKLMIGDNIVRKVLVFFSKSNKIAYDLKLGHQMKEIRKKLDDIAKNKHDLQLTDIPTETPIAYRDQREKWSFVSKDEIIGRDDEMKCIKSYLLDTNATNNVSIIPIVGFGGLGKTALAQLVYNDADVQRHFEQKLMWVYVSDKFDMKNILQKIIGDDKNSLMEQLQKELRSKIDRKKFLLVLDDVWNEDGELWLRLKSLFMEGGKGSMIIVTTRNQTVAKTMAPTLPPIFLKGLDSQKSWELFSREAFNDLKKQNDLKVLAIAKDIVKKCAGVPLALRSIGCFLRSRDLDEKGWEYFQKVEFSKIDMEKEEGRIFAILKVSYDHLTSFRKRCFAYCSLFPKGFVFEKKELIKLWVAEGFIQLPGEIGCLEDVGHEYFMHLLYMSFFQDVTIDDFGEISTCKMHDLMHDLAKLVAGEEYGVIEGDEANIGNRKRYLSSRTAIPFAETSSSSINKLRTFHCLGPESNTINYMHKSYFASLLGLKRLRVLTLHGCHIVKIPNSIEELKHLRYIDLSRNTELKYLPLAITSLQNLQTLKLSECSELRILPENINKSLRHLELNGCGKLECMPRGLGQLVNLQSLPLFVLDSSSGCLDELHGLNNLRGRLELKRLDFLREKAGLVEFGKILLEKRHLVQLELRWKYDEESGQWSVPSKMESSADEKILQVLQPHHSLQTLVIDGFCGTMLPDWIWNLSRLRCLEINNCNGLTAIPEAIRNLASLQKLSIYNCVLLEDRCAKSYGEDWPKISFIPKVVVLPKAPSLTKYSNQHYTQKPIIRS